MARICCPGTLALWSIAAALRWWIAPWAEKLPADYAAETTFIATSRSHERPFSPAVDTVTTVRCRDVTLRSTDAVCIVQGEAHWLTSTGAVIFETMNLYGVDRRNRENRPEFGNARRTGQYLFPPRVQKRAYGLWDPVYAGRCEVTFDHVAVFHGTEVYVFKFAADGVDETSGYVSLPDVPEKYGALTFGKGLVVVEPVSGVVVDREDEGVSHFIDPSTQMRVGQPINQWSERFTPETIEAQLRLASVLRRRNVLLAAWVPLGFAAAGLLWMGSEIGRRMRRRAPR